LRARLVGATWGIDRDVYKVVVDSRIRIFDPPAEVVARLQAEFSHPNPAKRGLDALEKAAKASGGGPWRKKAWARYYEVLNAPDAFMTWRWDDDRQRVFSVPRGGLQVVRSAFDMIVLFPFHDNRGLGDSSIGSPRRYTHKVALRDYQRALVEAAKEKQNCFWRSDTGSGKTTAALALIVELGLPAQVIVWTTNLLEQWVVRVVKELGIPAREVGVFAGSDRRVRSITIAMQQTLWGLSPEDAAVHAAKFGTVVCDELSFFAARTFADVIDKQTAKYRVGVSADERRKDGCEFLIYDAFGSQAGPEVPREELIARGDVVDVSVSVIPTDFAPGWYLDRPMADRSNLRVELVGEMIANEARNRQVIEHVAREAEQGEQVLVFSERVEHCLRLEAMLRERLPGIASRTGRLIGGATNQEEFRRTAAGLRSGRIAAAFGTYKAITYGTDLPSVARGVCATPMHSDPKQLNQVRGRICRADKASGKNSAELLYFWDRALFGLSALRSVKKAGPTRVLGEAGHWIGVREFLAQEG
jgi:superfamily II DNA or RNA helicase